MLVLLVDDDPDEFEVFCDALKNVHPGVRCLHAADGKQALQILGELTVLPTYIFLDINMPVMSGRELLKHIKGNAKFKSIPVIMYSTTSSPEEMLSFRKSGASDFLIKPVHFQDLRNALRDLIK